MSTEYSPYYDTDRIRDIVGDEQHRDIVGGLWDELGALQLELLKAHGLKPQQRLLDIGCGCLRGGVHFVRYLEPGHYYGTDLNEALLEAGYDSELGPLNIKNRLPRSNLVTDDSFSFERLGTTFDRALAFSLFTHLPLNSIRICLEKLADVMEPGGVFHATFFELPQGMPTHVAKEHQPAGILTHGDADPYHYRVRDLEYAIKGIPWRMEYVGSIDHPRGQRLINFVRLANDDRSTSAREVRDLPVEAASKLGPGEDHYRAYVGPPDRFDLMGATQFALLFQMGMRDHHRILDFGCGSLRLGRLLIPFLQPEGYFGIDPNRWLIDEAIDRELGADAITIKRPRFNDNSDYDCGVFGERFDFIVAQSIITHTGPDFARALFESVSQNLNDTGVFLFSYTRQDDPAAPLPEDGWHYPGCVFYTQKFVQQLAQAAGLHSVALPWHHPGAHWMAAARSPDALPPADRIGELQGGIVAAR